MADGVTEGHAAPIGVTLAGDGVNVAVHSGSAEAVYFCLFDASGEVETRRIRLPARTGEVFHGHVDGVVAGDRYGLRADGPWAPEAGHRFNLAKLLVDPAALALDRPFRLDPSLFDARRLDEPADTVDSAPSVPKAIIAAPMHPAPRLHPRPRFDSLVIYEMHVRGFSRLNGAVPPELRGTFAGLAHPASIGHLRDLGVTAVELLPSAAWLDERHLPPLGLSNYWGYNPIAYSAPDPRLAPGGFDEVRQAVAAMHDAGIAVILDVVYNHSGESDHLGPTVSMRGLDNAGYYRLQLDKPAYYINDAGCGNVLATERPAVLALVTESLRQWVERAGIDGFRFDLATTLARRADGFDPAAPILAAIEQDPLLRDTLMIAEPWDVGPGGYQLGGFPPRWGEWNDRYRDTMRRFFRGDGGMIGELATRLAGSADIFAVRRRPLSRGVNFVTAHDGFTLADLVAHEVKENRANGEDNRDGTDSNLSWNNGIEGPTENRHIRDRRRADIRALLAALLVSRGTPMLSMGDEFGRSQRGNNNAYAQDNPIAWLDWEAADAALLAFARAAIALRARHPTLRDPRPLTGAPRHGLDWPDVAWFGADGQPLRDDGWHDPGRSTLVAIFAGHAASGAPERLCVVLQGGMAETDIVLPAPAGAGWTRLLASEPASTEPLPLDPPAFRAAGRSVHLFLDRP